MIFLGRGLSLFAQALTFLRCTVRQAAMPPWRARGRSHMDGELRPQSVGRPRRIGAVGERAGPWTTSVGRREADEDGSRHVCGRHVGAPLQWGRGGCGDVYGEH